MGDLGKRLGVNKSTIQRYESKGVDPEKRYLVISLADALLTTPEWLTGLSDAKEYDSYTKCRMQITEHLDSYLKEMDSVIGSEAYQQFLAGHLCNIIDLYSVYAVHFARAMVCVRPDGAFESPATVSSVCRRARKVMPDLGEFHFHLLKHTFTTNLLTNGAAPKDVQELLGHSDVGTTMNIYAHANRETKRSSARMLDQVVS